MAIFILISIAIFCVSLIFGIHIDNIEYDIDCIKNNLSLINTKIDKIDSYIDENRSKK